MFFRQTKYISEQIRKSNIDIKRIKVEPYWNVNSFSNIYLLNSFKIKVEPYWNVNLNPGEVAIIEKTIKVEPYWNVNN